MAPYANKGTFNKGIIGNKPSVGIPENNEDSRYLTIGERKSISVDGKHLFDIKTGKQISEFDLFSPSLVGKDILIKGYPEQTATVDYYDKVYPDGKISVRFDNVFYVSEIIGWQRLHFIDMYDNKSVYYWSEAICIQARLHQ